jgi:hypothetical protein
MRSHGSSTNQMHARARSRRRILIDVRDLQDDRSPERSVLSLAPRNVPNARPRDKQPIKDKRCVKIPPCLSPSVRRERASGQAGRTPPECRESPERLQEKTARLPFEAREAPQAPVGMSGATNVSEIATTSSTIRTFAISAAAPTN